MCEAELRGPFRKEGDVVPDGTVVEQLVFFGNDILYDGALFIGEAFGQAVDDCHECPGFGFFGHSQSFDPTGKTVNSRIFSSRVVLVIPSVGAGQLAAGGPLQRVQAPRRPGGSET